MPTPSENLATSLGLLKAIQDQGRTAIRATDLTRIHRERLVRAGFLQEVMKGWYVAARPDETAGESTAWYAAFWAFAADYLRQRFQDDWCLSPEQSLSLHAGDWTVPRQLLVRSPNGNNNITALPHGTSVFDAKLALPPAGDIETKNGLRVMTLPAALIACAPAQYLARPVELRAALGMIPDASDVLGRLLEGGHSKVAGRLAGAFRNIGRSQLADGILATMRAVGYTIQESDPFKEKSVVRFGARETSPYVGRIRMMWAAMREPVLKILPAAPGIAARDVAAYLKRVDDIYKSDAYHSLSIEGYRVSDDLIDRVRAGDWDPDNDQRDRENKDALAARGYWQSFQAVKRSLQAILEGQDASIVADADHATWYRELFGPSVTAGILKPAELAGYRNGPVFIRRSMHVPPGREAVRELMPALFELLRGEKEPAARTVLGHFFFVYIHPYIDGNGRMGRFLMNTMLASGGYPWAVIPVQRRGEYMAALESASVGQDIRPFAEFLATLLKESTRW